MRPSFALLRLPLELQLHILCKCDFRSIRRLLQLSTSLRNLFVSYPEACIQETLRQLPQPIENLLRASWALHGVDNDQFDTDKTVALIQRTNIVEDWSTVYPSILHQDDDPFETLEGLMDLHDEVAFAAQLYAQCIHAVMETVNDPYVEILPVVLSTTEYTRVASSLWVLKVYYQLQLKFAGHPWQIEFEPAFMSHLRPWQVEQVSSVERLLQSLDTGGDSTLKTLTGTRYASKKLLSEQSLYFHNYFDVAGYNRRSADILAPGARSIIAFSQAAKRYSHTGSVGWAQFPYNGPHFTAALSARVTHLRNHGWMYFESVVSSKTRLSLSEQRYLEFFLDLGILIWDTERLLRYDLADPRGFWPACVALRERLQEARNRRNRMHMGIALSRSYQDQLLQDHIIQWTQCAIQCSFDEWMYQRIGLANYSLRVTMEGEDSPGSK